RILYVNAFVVMTAKLLLLYFFSRETETGKVRLMETRGKSLFSLLGGYGGVVKIIVSSRGTIFSLVIAALVGAVGMINTTFWQVIASKKLLVPDPLLPVFAMFRSVLAMVFLFTLIPRLHRVTLRTPLLFGFSGYAAGQILLVLTPPGGGALTYTFLCVSLVFDGFGSGALIMLAESLVALYVNAAERARVMAIQHMIIMFATAPFGWIGGLLSERSRSLPFVLNICLLFAGILVTLIFFYRNPEAHALGRHENLAPDNGP
ncbi:MAG: MFS transporter, partial [Treponema sp.]|nr:MFS transporter [Treponema sp.]